MSAPWGRITLPGGIVFKTSDNEKKMIGSLIGML
jgi:hypothetical protein